MKRSGDDSAVVALERIKREPGLLFTTAYLSVSVGGGLWCSYWFYAAFTLPILDYLQASDFLVAGLRDPVYVLLLLLGAAVGLVASWPETLALRNPDKIERLQRRNVWWRMVFSRSMFTR